MRLVEPGALGDVRVDLLEGEAPAPVPGRRLGVLYMIACNCDKAECDKYQFGKGKMLLAMNLSSYINASGTMLVSK